MSPGERVFTGAPAAIGRGLVASSFQYYLTGDDSLRVEAFCGSSAPPGAVDITLRQWREGDRAIQVTRERLVWGNVAFSRTDYQLDAGALLNVRLATTSAVPKFGDLFTRAQLVHGRGAGAEVVGTLLQGYISAQNDIAWPGSPLQTMHEGRGVVVTLPFTGGAGPSLSTVVPSGFRYRVVAARFAYVASAVAANRTPFVQIVDDAGNTFWSSAGTAATPASTTTNYAFAAAAPQPSSVFAGQGFLPFPLDVELGPLYTVRVVVDGAQAGDTISSAFLYVLRFMDQ